MKISQPITTPPIVININKNGNKSLENKGKKDPKVGYKTDLNSC